MAQPKHGLGYKPDPAGHTYNGFHLHPAAKLRAEAAPVEYDLTKSAPPIWDQNGTGSCTGHGFAGGITTTFHAQGHILPSPLWPRGLYTNGRIIDRIPNLDGKLPPIVDDGAMPNSLVRAMDLWGVGLEGNQDEGRTATSPDYAEHLAAHVNDEPTFLELEDESMFFVRGFNAISDFALDKVAQFCQAIASNHAVMSAIEASGDEFQGADGNKVLGPQGVIPDHWIYFAAYRTNAASKKEFLLINSWGLNWAKQGTVWVSEDFIRRGSFNTLVSDLGE